MPPARYQSAMCVRVMVRCLSLWWFADITFSSLNLSGVFFCGFEPGPLLEPQSRFGDKPLKFQVVCPENGTAILKGLKRNTKEMKLLVVGWTRHPIRPFRSAVPFWGQMLQRYTTDKEGRGSRKEGRGSRFVGEVEEELPTLLPGRGRETRCAPTIVMRRGARVL